MIFQTKTSAFLIYVIGCCCSSSNPIFRAIIIFVAVEIEVEGALSLSHKQVIGANTKLIPTFPFLSIEFELWIDTKGLRQDPKISRRQCGYKYIDLILPLNFQQCLLN